MTDFFEGIQSFFEDVLFAPLDYLRGWELENWWAANILNWVFILVGFAAFLYWMNQLKKFNDSGEEKSENSAHSFLG